MSTKGFREKLKSTLEIWINYRSQAKQIKELKDEIAWLRFMDLFGGICARFESSTMSLILNNKTMNSEEKIEQIKLYAQTATSEYEALTTKYPGGRIRE